jgi:hypothetical protein
MMISKKNAAIAMVKKTSMMMSPSGWIHKSCTSEPKRWSKVLRKIITLHRGDSIIQDMASNQAGFSSSNTSGGRDKLPPVGAPAVVRAA